MDRTNFDTPIVKTEIKTYMSFRITNITVFLNNKASLTVLVYNTNEFDSFVEIIELSGETYENWGTDDTYINNYVKNYLQEKYINTYA